MFHALTSSLLIITTHPLSSSRDPNLGGVQREEKRKKHVLQVGKLVFLLVIFSLLLFLYTSTMISRA
jgi:hypothetical protein